MPWAGVVAAVIAATVDVLYLGIVGTQGSNPEFLRVPFVAAFIALMAVCAALSSRASAARWRPLLLGVSAAGLLLLGFYAIFSIGLPLLLAGMVGLAGLIRTLKATPHGTSPRSAAGMAAGGAIASVVILLAGITLTELAISCPSKGTMTGGGITALGTSYTYSCNNGSLTISRTQGG